MCVMMSMNESESVAAIIFVGLFTYCEATRRPFFKVVTCTWDRDGRLVAAALVPAAAFALVLAADACT